MNTYRIGPRNCNNKYAIREITPTKYTAIPMVLKIEFAIGREFSQKSITTITPSEYHLEDHTLPFYRFEK